MHSFWLLLFVIKLYSHINIYLKNSLKSQFQRSELLSVMINVMEGFVGKFLRGALTENCSLQEV